ncbi:Chromosome partition protein Smc [compost metagenome]
MTSELKSLIEQIDAKSRQLHQSLVAERERVRSMTDEINRLNSDVSEIQNQKKGLEDELQNLKTELSQAREQVQVPPVSTNGVEIDVLVKEIDFCIQQLKIANE